MESFKMILVSVVVLLAAIPALVIAYGFTTIFVLPVIEDIFRIKLGIKLGKTIKIIISIIVFIAVLLLYLMLSENRRPVDV